MGKYTRKSKSTSEVAIMDVAHSSLGVWTRAKKLALQRLQKSSSVTSATTTTAAASVGRSYLQLRSRRLEKPPILVGDSKRQKHILKDACLSNPNPSTEPNNSTTNSPDSLKEIQPEIQKSDARDDLGFEACFGENVMESESCCDRSERESTPCSLIRDTENIKRTHCSTDVRLQDNNNTRMQNIPTANEMEELFAGPEQHQQSEFIEKYNFDPVNEKPLPGRYEWEKLNL
ncbi:cyclin-dependent kinase inhibitor 5-like [Impatiens glandulifera]|uniref:cyclin-dependent kinase inhibitor 5-like n=1 Tax=Impatiens glandulifera TaxID=253017 RepID=UPI001FB0D173|nr:cyclin-dependent kinase inhibitor 5-like [Impatiens glandulifera]